MIDGFIRLVVQYLDTQGYTIHSDTLKFDLLDSNTGLEYNFLSFRYNIYIYILNKYYAIISLKEKNELIKGLEYHKAN